MSIAQLLLFNCTSRRRETTKGVYNSKQMEPPLPIYVGLTVHAETRKRFLVDKLHDLGLSISYHRILEISTAAGNSVCQQYHDQVSMWNSNPSLPEMNCNLSELDNVVLDTAFAREDMYVFNFHTSLVVML
jgi:hypothetical protein